ncbi:cellobiose 2-epimerase [Bacteroidales bacterium]|nr:cellobiose 2-epimerase [Bacteroidales bacterium]
MNEQKLKQLYSEVCNELKNNILPYWINGMQDQFNGGFYGQIDGKNKLHPKANKGGILNARILWTFSSAYRVLKDPIYLQAAQRAKEYISKYFIDPKFGGTYWLLTYQGEPCDTKKQIYAIAFTIYGLSEYYRACGDEEALNQAKALFYMVEKYSFDSLQNGYFEAYSREWILLDDLRLSDKDANEKKTMNTHLHILEAYTNLYRVWKDKILERQLTNLILVFLDKIIDPSTNHQNLFFDQNWKSKHQIVSYGHDIEAAWLIDEAAKILGDKELLSRVHSACLKLADAAREGLQADGSLIYELNKTTNHRDTDRHWWVQAEAILGLLNAFELTGQSNYLEEALKTWQYTKKYLIDHKNGEWHWSIAQDGTINTKDDKAGAWKCPYHNGRMCLEIIERFSNYSI